MSDIEKEKLSPEQEKQRDKINILIENAEKSGKGITKIMDSIGKKSYYFRHVVTIPLKEDFKSFIKSQFNVNIDKELEEKRPLPSEILETIPKVIELQRKIEDLLVEIKTEQSKRIDDKDTIIELQKEIARLKDKHERKSS